MSAKRSFGPSPEFIEWFCEEYGSTDETHDQVLARVPPELGKAPCKRTLGAWIRKSEAFQKQYKAAQEFKGNICLDEAQREADNARMGVITTEGERAGKTESMTKTIDNVERSKLRVQVLIARAKAFNPALRDNAQVEVKGGTGVVLVHSVPQPPKEEKACQPTEP